ncbi:stage II sporulation protein P [Geomicrobium sediminis]|uniref:Stage II sporulation protein P n=1 Tax=Geomicrobium sediminis TaxID=1347788 RepID=A0ABS2PF59_9BACL|nr:stage II sporulation protein P [Geomicrobium sediminis]MBM7633986.1 stage II sporulation protein P [Geomicrobium sediminis]
MGGPYQTNSSSKLNVQITAGFALIVMVFFIVAMLTTSENHTRFSSSVLHQWIAQVQSDWFVHLLGVENRYYLDPLNDSSTPNLAALAFELTTNINLEDPRTFLGRELPGFSNFDDTLVIAGEGTDFTTMPMESTPPPEVQQEKALTSSQHGDRDEKERMKWGVDNEEPLIHIIHSHSRESFLPEIDREDATHPEINIIKVGKYLASKFREHGLPVEVAEHDIQQKLNDRDWPYNRSYEMSREIILEAKTEYDGLEFFFDLHRDSQPRDITTVTINGEVYARTMFVIGEGNPGYEKNLAMAEEIHHRLEDQFPGLSRGVIMSGGQGVNGVYNQDLSPNSMVIEFGGIDNNFEEVYRSVDVFADVFQGFIYEELND